MFCRQYTINLKKIDEIIQLRPLGDIHIGNLGCDLKKFENNINFVAKRDDHFVIGMGDYIDNVMAYAQGGVDKRWNPETVDRKTLTTEEQVDKFIELWTPIKDKTFGLLAGNHEWKTINQILIHLKLSRSSGTRKMLKGVLNQIPFVEVSSRIASDRNVTHLYRLRQDGAE